MSGPLPLRLCCMAAMAPALTEAATQAKIKLPGTSAAATSDSVSRQNIRQPALKEGHLGIPREKLSKIGKSYGALESTPVSHLNGDSHRSVDKQPSVFSTLQRPLSSIKVSANIKPLADLIRTDKGGSFKHEFLKAIRSTDLPNLGKLPQIMNQPSPGLGNEEGKCHGHSAQNGSHTQSLSDIGRSAGGDSRGAPQTQPASGQSLTQGGFIRNMCRKVDEGGRAVSNTNNSSSPGGSQTTTSRQAQSTAAAHTHSVVSSPESNVDSDRVDEGVENARLEASKKQAQLERRIEFLQRRLRRAQGRQVEGHIRQQLVTYEQYQAQNLQTVAKTISNPTPSNENTSDLKKELMSDDVKNLSTAALVNLVHRIQASNSFQPQPQSIKPEVTSVLTMADDVRKDSKMTAEKLSMNLNFMQSALDSDVTESSSGGESSDDDVGEGLDLPLPSTPLVRRAEWKWCSERAAVASRWTWLQAQVSDLEYRIRQQSEIYRQARHSKGQVVLGDPPPPLDFLRAATSQGMLRGSVVGDVIRSTALAPATAAATTEVSPCNVSAVLSNVDKQASRLTQSLHCLSPANTSPASSLGNPKSRVSSPATAAPLSASATTPNGLIDSPLSTGSVVDVEGTGSPPGLSSSSAADSRLVASAEGTDLSPVLDATCRAARCLPLKNPLRKRKLLRTSGLHLRSAKAARLSSVKCHCHPPVTPCVLCGGRLNSVQAVDPDSMPYQERVALLDHSYHQVLSFKEEVPLSVHFEALLRSGEWQNKPQVRRARSEHSQRCQKYVPSMMDNRKKPFRKNAASVIIQSAKIRNKYDQKAGRKPGAQRGKRLNKRALNAELKRRRNTQFNAGLGMKKKNFNFLGNNYDTPAASPLSRDANSATGGQKEVRKRRGESAYDINNIVIPHSMASLTRVEKLEYKEIPIPSWRDITDETVEMESPVKLEVHDHKSNGLITKATLEEEEEVEDLSDESYILRHKICESEEKNRFSTFVQYPPTRRNRTQSLIGLSAQDPSSQNDPNAPNTRPATPSTPNAPVSMGTQASLDGGDFPGEDSMDAPVSLQRISAPPVPRFTVGPAISEDESVSVSAASSGISGGGSMHEFSIPQRDRSSLPASQRERLSLGSSADQDSEWDRTQTAIPSSTATSTTPTAVGPTVQPWPLRLFPLSEEEFANLTLEEAALPDSKQQMSLSVVSAMGALRPQPVEGCSQAGSSVSGGSLPASPMPSSSSASATGDYDAADPEWVAEAETSKKLSAGQQQHKAVKR